MTTGWEEWQTILWVVGMSAAWLTLVNWTWFWKSNVLASRTADYIRAPSDPSVTIDRHRPSSAAMGNGQAKSSMHDPTQDNEVDDDAEDGVHRDDRPTTTQSLHSQQLAVVSSYMLRSWFLRLFPASAMAIIMTQFLSRAMDETWVLVTFYILILFEASFRVLAEYTSCLYHIQNFTPWLVVSCVFTLAVPLVWNYLLQLFTWFALPLMDPTAQQWVDWIWLVPLASFVLLVMNYLFGSVMEHGRTVCEGFLRLGEVVGMGFMWYCITHIQT